MHAALPALALGLVLAAAPASAQDNLFRNSQLDEDLTDWSAPTGSLIQWEAVDVDDAPDSGSLLLTNAAETGGGLAAQCVPVSEGQILEFGGWVNVLPGQDQIAGVAGMGGNWFSDADCTSFLALEFPQTNGVLTQTAGVWTEVRSARVDGEEVTSTFPVPAGANSVLAGPLVLILGSPVPFSARFDDLFFRVVPEPEAGAAGLTACLALAGLAALRRR